MAENKVQFTIALNNQLKGPLGQALRDINGFASGVTSRMNAAQKAVATFNQHMGRSSSAIGNVTRSIMGLAGAYVGINTITQLGKSFVQTASQAEAMKASLENNYGSVEKATETYNLFMKTAAKMPFSFMEIAQAGTVLQNFDKNIDFNKWLTPFLDMAAKMKMVNPNLTLAEISANFGKAFSGNIGAADLLREYGITNLINQTAKLKYNTDVTKLSMQGLQKVIYETFTDGSKGVAGMTDKLANTFQGRLSNLGDAWDQFKLKIADAGFWDVLKEKLEKLLKRLEELEKNGDLNKWAKQVSKNLEIGVKKIGEFYEKASKVYKFLSDNSHAVKAVAVLVAIGIGFVKLASLIMAARGAYITYMATMGAAEVATGAFAIALNGISLAAFGATIAWAAGQVIELIKVINEYLDAEKKVRNVRAQGTKAPTKSKYQNAAAILEAQAYGATPKDFAEGKVDLRKYGGTMGKVNAKQAHDLLSNYASFTRDYRSDSARERAQRDFQYNMERQFGIKLPDNYAAKASGFMKGLEKYDKNIAPYSPLKTPAKKKDTGKQGADAGGFGGDIDMLKNAAGGGKGGGGDKWTINDERSKQKGFVSDFFDGTFGAIKSLTDTMKEKVEAAQTWVSKNFEIADMKAAATMNEYDYQRKKIKDEYLADMRKYGDTPEGKEASGLKRDKAMAEVDARQREEAAQKVQGWASEFTGKMQARKMARLQLNAPDAYNLPLIKEQLRQQYEENVKVLGDQKLAKEIYLKDIKSAEEGYYKWQKEQLGYYADFNFAQLQRMLKDEKATEEEKYRIKAEIDARIQRGDVGGREGFAMGLQDSMSLYKKWAQMMVEIGQQTSEGLTTAFSDTFFHAFKGDVDSIRDVWDNLCRNLVDSFARAVFDMIAQAMTMKVVKPLIDSLFAGPSSESEGSSEMGFFSAIASMFGGGSGGGGTSSAATMSQTIKFAKGGVFRGAMMPIMAFANGGIMNRPTLGIFAEAGMNEAAVPLPDGKRIPVDLGGAGGGGQTIIEHHYHINAMDPKSFNEYLASNGGQTIAAISSRVVKTQAPAAVQQDYKRNGGTRKMFG